MFTEITWAMYLRVTLAILFIYYTLLFLKFYFPKIRASFSNDGTSSNPLQAHGAADMESAVATSTAEAGNLTPKGEFNEPGLNDYEIIEELVERIKGCLKDAAAAGEEEAVLTGKLKKIINDYPLLTKSTFLPSINEFIATESQQHGYPALTEASIDALWHKA